MAATRTTLGISPGTRTMGFAVIRDGELIEWRVKTYKGRWSEDKLAHILGIIERMLAYYDVSFVSLKKVDPLKSSRQLDALTERIICRMLDEDIRTATYSIHDLNAATGRKQRHLHNSIAEHVLEKYPVLREEYTRVEKIHHSKENIKSLNRYKPHLYATHYKPGTAVNF